MKSSDEMVNSLLERREQYISERKRRRKALARTITWVCCICLVALLGFGVWQNGRGNPPPEQEAESGVAPGSANALYESAGNPAANDHINIQTVQELPANTAQMLFALMVDDFIPMSRDEINEYYGVNIFPAVPGDLESKQDETFGIFKRKNTGELYWDSNAVNYANWDCSRNVNVSVDKDCLPFDFMNLFDDVRSKSVINNTEVGIAKTPYGEFYAEFMIEGVGFRVVTYGLTQDELVSVVSSLIK